ncbi:hypothetical protein HYFRA_00004490 [Hymenoscyphus fraxineus]|uniref:TPR-like protein n=1 Tax=Hymenoscyphus fraxineus TaxID=746836 RepID=A0A9N9KXE5_9HELO|nr:hypothetical protein HYFRA_00004490 [Hymenoscyphus fraxineus]
MDNTNQPSKKHVRHGSSGRALPRRPTRGPLDESDPTSNPLTSPTVLAHQNSSRLSPIPSRYHTPRLPSPTHGSNLSMMSSQPSFKTANSTIPATTKDFTHLLRPEIYHPLTLIDVPPPFRTNSSQPDPSTPLQALLEGGHFRSAAIKASQHLTSPSLSPSNHQEIFDLIYTRLSCLTLCNQTALAAQEVKSLEDLNSAYYLDETTGQHLVPWHLRVLAVRLQGMGYADARRGVMGYYDLAREARISLSLLKKNLSTLSEEDGVEKVEMAREISVLEGRLDDLGIRVASALIEMEDLEGAARFLKTLRPGAGDGRLEYQKALLFLCLGDVDSARECIATSEDGDREKKVVKALAAIADAEYGTSVEIWESLISDAKNDDGEGAMGEVAMYLQNLAVCYLYLGRMDEARTTLESLLTPSDQQKPSTFHALTFNLSTIYELCTERSRALKISLAERVADILREERAASLGQRTGPLGIGVGGEKVNGDFKL